MADIFEIAGRIHSTSQEGVTTVAGEILDENKGKKQSQINTETDAALADRYAKEETYSKNELNNLITTPNQEYESYAATDQTTDVTEVLPATGEDDTVYRVGNWDGSQFDASVYSEYAWNGSSYVHLSTKTQIGEVFDISAYHATGGTLATYADLSAALDSNNGGGVPQSLQKGGMSVKYVRSSDNKYVQFRYMGTETTGTPNPFLDVANWQGVDKELVDGSPNLVESGGVAKYVKENALEEKEHLITDNDVAGYLTDKNKLIIAKLMKNGSVEWLVENTRDLQIDRHFDSIDELLSYVSTEIDSENDIIKYITDKNGIVIATINNDGDTCFKGGGGFDGEITKFKKTNFDAIKVLTDKNGSVIEWIDTDAVVHLYSIQTDYLNVKDPNFGLSPEMISFISFIANGIENHKFVTDRTISIIKGLSHNIHKEGVKISTYPVMSIHDDDAWEFQLPESYIHGATESTQPYDNYSKRAGFSSILWPLLHSLNLKHKNTIKGKLTCGVCAEGQRIGLTPLYSLQDTFNGTLNSCGKIIKALVEKDDWECHCHSMIPMYIDNSYLVEGLDSEFANSLLVGATYSGYNGLNYATTTCYDTVTKKNYKVKPDFSGWDECPIQYAKPYLAVSKASNSRLVINPTYSVKYQVKTWLDRCDIAGLPHTRTLVGWGASHSEWHILEDQRYIDTVISTSSEQSNTVPYMVNPTRNRMMVTPSENNITEHTDDYNVYNRYDYERLKSYIDDCVRNRAWSIWRLHAAFMQYKNTYSEYFTDLYGVDSAYCGELCYKDDNYPEEWIVPLKHDELLDMCGENVHDYWNNPPSRLNISTWDEWYPCPGTTLAMFYDLLEYAITQGVTFANTQDILDTFGNILAVGVESAGETAADRRLPETDKVGFFCKIGADNSYEINIKQ